MTTNKLILAVPKGRILKELMPLLEKCGIIPEADFTNKESRKLRFTTNHENLDIIRVRAFDVATFVAYGGAHLGVVGSDALEEFQLFRALRPAGLKYWPLPHVDCHAQSKKRRKKKSRSNRSHIRIATKYPHITSHAILHKRGVQAECIKLSGAMEIAPSLKARPSYC